MSVQINGTNGLVFADGSTQKTAANGSFKNRIINGAMMLNQRAGGTVTILNSVTYSVDRWFGYSSTTSKFSLQQSSVAPAGFTNSLLATSLSAYSITSSDEMNISQRIEGFNVADLGWGTANAQTVTLSFWVRSSLTGTFGGSFYNSGNSRSYPFSYTISAANTWEQKTVTVAGDTTGTWVTADGLGLGVTFCLGAGATRSSTAGSWASGNFASATGATSVVGTNGATFYITGVQLEKGSTATSFDYRPYGAELALCQRYYEKSSDDGLSPTTSSGLVGWTSVGNNSYPRLRFQFKVNKRATPTVTFYDTNGVAGQASTWNNGTITSGSVSNVQFNTTEASAERQDGTTLSSRSFVYGAYVASAEL